MKKINLSCILFLVMFLTLAACSGSSDNTGSKSEEAQEGLETLRVIANNDDFEFFGYNSRDEIGQEELGEPIEVKTIDFDKLQTEANPEDNIDKLVINTNESIFPVIVNGEVRSSIRVALIDGEYEVVSSGSSTLAKDVFRMIRTLGLNLEDAYLLELPGLDTALIGRKSSGNILVTPLYDNTELSLDEGVSIKLSLVAEKLKEYSIERENEYEHMKPVSSSEEFKLKLPVKTDSIKSEVSSGTLLDVVLYPQEQNQWCWAATGRMTMLFAGGNAASTITQCAEANNAFTQSTCCNYGGSSQCNKPYLPLYENWGFNASSIYDDGNQIYLSFNDLKSLIDSRKPIAFLWGWKSGGGHYMAAVGYSEDLSTRPPTRIVHVYNPWPPNKGNKESYYYNSWLGGPYYDHTLTCLFTNISKK
jgi:hypothetical protein